LCVYVNYDVLPKSFLLSWLCVYVNYDASLYCAV